METLQPCHLLWLRILNITKVVEVEIANILLFSNFFSDLSTFPFFLLIFHKSPQKVAVRVVYSDK